MILSPWFCLLLAICLPSVCGLSHFPHKMQVMEKYQSVKLTCRTDADVRGPVTWKHKVEGLDQDRPVMKSRFANPSGLSLSLTDLDTPNAGEYSCWAEGRKLDHTYLFLKEDEDSQPTEGLVCVTQTYSCSVTCHLSAEEFTAARLSYHRVGQNSSGWQAPVSVSTEGKFRFILPLSQSPFAEESAAMQVTAEAVNDRLYLKKTLSFYLRDIVQPDPPQSVSCERKGKVLSVTAEPPPTWAKPHSFFPLVHQVQFINKHNGKMDTTDTGMIVDKVSMLRVRFRDPLVPSAWSEWSPWKNVTRRSKRKHYGAKVGRVSLPLREGDSLICKKTKTRKKMTTSKQT